jgi:hypothetical protein
MSGRYRGLRRGLPWPWLIAGGLDLLFCWGGSARSQPSNYADYWYRRAGRRFARVFAQGYWEKFRGQKWADMPVPQVEVDASHDAFYSFNAIKHGLMLAAQGGPSGQQEWRHPAKGTGQIYDTMLNEVLSRGGQIKFKAEVTGLKSAGEHIVEVLTNEIDGPGTYRPRHVVSSMQIEDLTTLLSDRSVEMTAPNGHEVLEAERSVVLAYLFLNEPPAFPHAWLEVNDPELKAGRITNYAAFNGDMIPPGKTCLCVEFFCFGDDPILRLSPEELENLATKECVANALIDATRLVDAFVATMRRSNAASGWRDWQSAAKLQRLERIKQFENLYYVNRPGADWATFAGMMAGKAILQGCRAEFDRRADPTRNCALAQAATVTENVGREKLERGARSGVADTALATIWPGPGNVLGREVFAPASDLPGHQWSVGSNRPALSEPEAW